MFKWVNSISNYFYIGSAKDLSKRLQLYYQNALSVAHPNRGYSKICNALLKYGYSNFHLEILEYCKKEELIIKEQYYLDTLNPSYKTLLALQNLFWVISIMNYPFKK